MDSPQIPQSPINSFGAVKSSSSSTRVVDDVTSLTSFNPFSEEDEHEQSSYALVSSLFSKVKNSFSAPLTTAVAAASNTAGPSTAPATATPTEAKRTADKSNQGQSLSPAARPPAESRPRPFKFGSSVPSLAPPLVTPLSVDSELREPPTYNVDFETASVRGGMLYSPTADFQEGGLFGTAIPGFPIQDQSDARSIHTSTSLRRSESVSKIIRRIRGDGLSRNYWMNDELCKECYLCKSIFTTWRRKHHCRICGQIFCSRCASNIIKGSRLGSEGMLRVCNLCLDKLHYDDDDDDDRRSVFSSVSSPFVHGGDGHNQSLLPSFYNPFAGSQLFGRSEDPYSNNLFSIAEARRHLSGSDGSGLGSRPLTPGEEEIGEDWFESGGALAAPFRRGVADDEKDPVVVSVPFPSDQPPPESRSGNETPIDVQISAPSSIDASKSTIQFPQGSPEQRHGLDSPRQSALIRSRVSSFAGMVESPTPFLRSRVQSHFDELSPGEIGWRTRRVSTAYAQELNSISLFHMRIMLRQLLTSEGISNVREWEDTLSKLALRIARDLTFTAHTNREGGDMDVRRYVKIKKIPGGCPRHSEYVDGVVITKNVAHRQMTRSQKNPRIMLVTFPLDFQRVEGQYMHFPQILRQEKEYLENLVSRIAALRPHIVLVEKTVSRLALDELVKHHIAVARSVKPSAIQLVARMTQGDVFSSMDKLSFEPRLGHCAQFKIQTFDHPLIPTQRKTFMRFEGCSPDLGCTIILRGGNMDQLKRVKKVALFMTFIVRNLKLETHLWKDSALTVPQLTTDAAPQDYVDQVSPSNPTSPIRPRTYSIPMSFTRHLDANLNSTTTSPTDDLPSEDVQAQQLSRRIKESLDPYLKNFISVSATLRFPPPYPIRKMKALDDELIRLQRAWEDEVISKEERPSAMHAEEPTITANDDISLQIDRLPVPELTDSPDTPTPDSKSDSNTDSSLVASDYFERKLSASASFASLKSPVDPGATPTISTSQTDATLEDVQFKNESDIAAESAVQRAKWQCDEQRRVWEWYLRKNKDDFAVEKYQSLTVLEFYIPLNDLGHSRPCFPPRLRYFQFYGENDCTLGQFIDKEALNTLSHFLNPKAVCDGKACDQPLASHCTVFLHDESRVLVYVNLWDPQIKTKNIPPHDVITTWSVCRICNYVAPLIAVSAEMQRFSFAKFLELHFYPADVHPMEGAGCPHNIYRHHIRYFAVSRITVMFEAEPITLYELRHPPSKIHIRPETLLHLKNADYERLLKRNAHWYSALDGDLKLINIDAATGDEVADAKFTSEINVLIERAFKERTEIAQLIQQVYKETSPTDTLALNRVRAERQDKIVAWQHDFDKLPKSKVNEKEGRKSAFDSVRAIWPKRYDFPGFLDGLHLPPSSVLEIDEMPSILRRGTRESMPVAASDTSDAEMSPKLEIPCQAPDTQLVVPPDENSKEAKNSDPDSDSTIGAVRGEELGPVVADAGESQGEGEGKETMATRPPRSRLPRRSGQHPSVAELVKRYQEFLPASLSEELASRAFPPSVPPSADESDTDALQIRRPARQRSKPRAKGPRRKDSVSDFEHSYAVNAAPRYAIRQGNIGKRRGSTLITGLPVSSTDSRESSRRASPDKRPTMSKHDTEATLRAGRLSPTPGKTTFATTPMKPRLPSRSATRERIPLSRQASTTNPKVTLRRTSNAGPASKVSNIARHFERIHKDTERASRRYAVIRGRRARPVASARVTVEVFDSIKEAIKDEFESSSSSEADDEGEGDDERDGTSPKDSPPDSSLTSSMDLKDSSRTASKRESQTSVPSVELTTTESEIIQIPLTQTPSAEAPVAVPSSLPSPSFLPQTPSETPSTSDIEAGPSTIERHSTFMRALSGFWPQHGSSARSIMEGENDDPMADPEHIFRESAMVVRTDEPTSIIALALNSPQYREMLTKSRAEKRQAKEPRLSEGGEAFMPDDVSVSDSASTWGVVNVGTSEDGNPRDDLRVPSSKLPWAISFESGGLTISCTILFPEQFDALRRTYYCDRTLIESLARCVKWNATGGKSGSAFLKTKDDRFIAKELSRAELETMTTFAPAYFDYMSSTVTADRPTLLAKVFGCYKVVFRKSGKGKDKSSKKSTQMNLLVMENLFYDKTFTKIYDLKGSYRNRHVQATGRQNEVLLDENLVQTAYLSPFYVREHSKRILRGALFNDTKFLADINVMDYSLLVGVDSTTNELVVGIVDYIRTYTWDKKLESWVKDTAFLNAAAKGEPTIVTPKQYRQRFLSAMERYFPMVPDRWMKQKDAPEEEGNSLLELWPDW